MVAGKLEARGRGFGNIKFTLQEHLNSVANDSMETTRPNNVQFVAGRTNTEGRLNVKNLLILLYFLLIKYIFV